MFGANSDPQWGRRAEVVFTNFFTGLQTTIDSTLRIQFEYTKTIDESKDSSNGTITIYGLTEETFNAIGERLKCEVRLSAGYIYSKTNTVRELFNAVLMDKTYEVSDGDSVSTFTILGDFVKKNIGKKISSSYPTQVHLMEVFSDIANFLNMGYELRIPPHPDSESIGLYLNDLKMPYGYSAYGTPKQELARLCKSYGFEYSFGKGLVELSIQDSWMAYYAEKASESQGKNSPTVIKAADNKTAVPVSENVSASNTPTSVKAPTFEQLNSNTAIFYSLDTGLIGSPKLKTVEVKQAYEQALRPSEEIVSKKLPRARVNKKGEIVRDKTTGEVKMTKTPKFKKIARRQVEARIYINASVVPRVYVMIATPSGITDGTYRVRSLKITGDTEGEAWWMDLVLND